MKRFVADASFCGAWILPDESMLEAEALLQRVEKRSAVIVVPSLWYYEMGNLICSAVRRRRLDDALGLEAIRLVAAVPVTVCALSDSDAMERALKESLKFGLSFYDAAYLELARRFRLPLLTADRQLRNAASSSGLETVLV